MGAANVTFPAQPARVTAPDGVPRLISEKINHEVWKFRPDSDDFDIDIASVTAPSAGVGTVQLIDHNGPTYLQVVITNNEPDFFQVQHGEQGISDYEWIINGVTTAAAVPYEALSARFA